MLCRNVDSSSTNHFPTPKLIALSPSIHRGERPIQLYHSLTPFLSSSLSSILGTREACCFFLHMILRIGEDTSTKGRDRVHCLKIVVTARPSAWRRSRWVGMIDSRLEKIAPKFLSHGICQTHPAVGC